MNAEDKDRYRDYLWQYIFECSNQSNISRELSYTFAMLVVSLYPLRWPMFLKDLGHMMHKSPNQ